LPCAQPLYDGSDRWKKPPPVGLTKEELEKLRKNKEFMSYQKRLGYEWPDEL